MKKLAISILSISLIIASCGAEQKQEETEGKGFSVKENTTILKWTAYKTTEKKPVGGEFTEVNITNVPVGKTAHEALNGLTFSIPVSSTYTDNESRDTKIKTYFFGVMKNTELISGEFSNIEGNEEAGIGIIKLKMNEVVCDLPFEYTMDKNQMNITSDLNILSWKAQAALDSINNACYDLHKGEDGISKTWEEVTINASIEIKQN